MDLERLAARQDGVVTTAQAVSHGVTRWTVHRQAGAGRWKRLRQSTWLLPGFPMSWRVRCRAAAMAHRAAVLTGMAAVRWWGMAGDDWLEQVELTVPTGSGRGGPGVVLRRRSVDPADVVDVAGLRVLLPLAAVLDCVGRRPQPAIVAVMEAGMRDGHFTLEQLARSVSGTRALAAFLLVDVRSQSAPETWLRLLLHGGGLWWQPQVHVVHDGRDHVVDLGDPDARIGADVDGYEWHGFRSAFKAGLRRGVRVRLARFDRLVFSPADIRDFPASTLRACRELAAQARAA